jgi:hypothetical protein
MGSLLLALEVDGTAAKRAPAGHALTGAVRIEKQPKIRA